MKKTLTVNLEGRVFQIDENAYILLDEYLKNLRYHFRKEEGGDEIVCDIETRIGELFAESIEGGQTVITLDNVEAVITRMGRPEELDDEVEATFTHVAQEEEHQGNEGETTSSTDGGDNPQPEEQESADQPQQGTDGQNQQRTDTDQHYYSGSNKVVRKLYRDIDNRILGGVLSGIAAYFRWDRTALRIIVIILGLVLKMGLPLLLVYFILQCVIPAAITATQKLEMRGEPVNVENIGRTVTDRFERERKPNYENRSGLQKFFDVLVAILGIFLKIFIFFLLVCCFPIFFAILIALFVLVMAIFGLFVQIPEFCTDLMPIFPWDAISDHYVSGSFFLLGVLLVVGIPLAGVVITILQTLGYRTPVSPMGKLALLGTWFLALIICFITFFIVQV